MDDYLERARREMFPMMKSAALTVTILGDPDPKLCLELGAAIPGAGAADAAGARRDRDGERGAAEASPAGGMIA